MRNFCVCIGVDGYKDPRWRLGSCVNDAIAFADWAVTRGGVAAADLRMFLSPADQSVWNNVTLPVSGFEVPCAPATRNNIFQLVLDGMPQADWARDGERLYWYFAGHGCSHESVRGSARPEPVLFPADVESLPLNANNLIGFSDIIGPLSQRNPPVQLFFLDACRDFALPNYASSAGPPSGRYLNKLPEEGAAVPARQYVLYATAPGERAVELGQGVFGDILIQGLSGAPGALLRMAGLVDYQLTYSGLVSYVRREVQAKVKKALLARPTRFVQVPAVEADSGEQDFVVAHIPNEQIAPLDVFIRVRPQSTHPSGCVQIYFENSAVPPPCGPPLKSLNRLSLKPAYYRIEASSPGMRAAQKTISVPSDDVVELELIPGDTPGPAPTTLRFFTHDRNLPVLVWDVESKPHVALHQVSFADPKPGLYRAMVSSPEGGSPPKGYTFPDCGSAVELDVQPLAVNSAQALALEQMGIASGTALVTPSERLGGLSDVRTLSLLGFAAYATYVLRDGGSRLRSFGMLPVAKAARSKAWVTVLIGASGYEPAPDMSVTAFLEKVNIALIGTDASATNLHILPNFTTAGQVLAECPEGSFSVELRLPGVPVTRYAMIGMPGRIAVLAATIDDNQVIEAQQYLFAFDQIDLAPEDLPKLERAQRYYANGRPIPDPIVDALLNVKQIDPLQACLAGYSLARQRNHRRFVGTFIHMPHWNPESPLENMLNFFDALPDTHVLAGLCDAGKREEHYLAALARGIPLFSDGFRTLIEHFGDRALEVFPPGPRRAMRTLSSGSLFSAWVSWEPVIGIGASGFEPPPNYWRSLESHRDAIETCIRACGLITGHEDGGASRPFGTAFLVAPDLILTTNHVVGRMLTSEEGLSRESEERAALEAQAVLAFKPGLTVTFSTANEPAAAGPADGQMVAEVVGIDRDARLALLRLSAPIDGVAPIEIASSSEKIEPRSEIYLVGYPHLSMHTDEGLVQHVFSGRFGVKRLQPGMVLAAPDTERSFDHDASTLPGNAGSPVIDLDTGRAIGVHWGGMEEAGHKRGRASALTLLANRTLLAPAR